MTDIQRSILTTHLSPLSRHALLSWILRYAQEHPEEVAEEDKRGLFEPRRR